MNAPVKPQQPRAGDGPPQQSTPAPQQQPTQQPEESPFIFTTEHFGGVMQHIVLAAMDHANKSINK